MNDTATPTTDLVKSERVQYVGLAMDPHAKFGDMGTTVCRSAPTPTTTKWLVRWDNGRERLYWPSELQRVPPGADLEHVRATHARRRRAALTASALRFEGAE